MEDGKIVALLNERSEQGLSELMDRYGTAVRGAVRSILSQERDREECVNDTWLAAWNAIPPEHPKYLGAWLCGVARNLALKRCRDEHAGKRYGGYDAVLEELEDIIPAPASVDSELQAKELSHSINRFLETCSQRDRFLFLRRYWFGDSVSEIAAAANEPPHAVSQRLLRLRKKLQLQLKKEGMQE